MFTAAAQVAAVERRVTAYSEAGQGTDSSQPSFRVSEPYPSTLRSAITRTARRDGASIR